MKTVNQLYKNTFIIVLFVFGVITLYTIKTEETPRFILFFGRFHPLVLHLPIGALVVTFFLEVVRRLQKNKPSETIKHLLGFTALFSIITSFFGYFLSLEGGYASDTLDIHFYTGIATAIFTTSLFYLTTRHDFTMSKIFMPFFVFTLILISVTGHFGSVLTHGDNFLTEYATAEPKAKTIEVVDSLKIYEDVVFKILDSKCVQCHNASKQKGDLSMLTPDLLLKGGVSGTSLVAGNPENSLLYTRVLLPISDEEHMPPEGKEQLTKDEIWLVNHWIENGANFEDYAIDIASNDTLRDKLNDYLVFNKTEIPKASIEDIERVKASGFRVFEIVPNEAALNVKLLDKTPNLEIIEELETIEEQIVELDFSDFEVTNKMMEVIKKMKNLKFLKVNHKNITDTSLKYIKDLEQLEVLNLYQTSITDDGLSELLNSIQPKTIYSTETQVTDAKAQALEQEYGVKIQNSLLKGFVEDSQLQKPIVSTERTLFRDTIHVSVKSPIKDVDVRYTLDGKIPDSTSKKLNKTLVFDKSTTLKVATFKDGWLPSDILMTEFIKVAKHIEDFSIVNKPNVSLNCLEDVNTWILYPTDFIVYASSSKSTGFKKVGAVSVNREGEGSDAEFKKVHMSLNDVEARYFKIVVKNHPKLPEWHPAAGNPAWIFVDEIFFW